MAGIFEVLAEAETTAPRTGLERGYGAALLLTRDRVAVNFVSSIDGIVSFGMRSDDSRAVGGGVVADRLLMAMLRAVAGVIIVGAGTLRATLNHQWTAAELSPDNAAELVELRTASGMPASPAPLLVVSGSGRMPAEAEAVALPATPLHVLSAAGLDATDLPTPDAQGSRHRLEASAILAAARGLSGGGPVLCEGGPNLLGSLLEGAVPLDLFLTVAPQLAGRDPSDHQRRSLVEGVSLPPFARCATVRSVRRAGQHLLLRYAVDAQPGPS